MNILIAAAEMTPFVRNGNVGDAVAELAGEFRRMGHEVSVVLPCYRTIREGKAGKLKKTGVKFSVPVGAGRYPCEIFESKAAAGVQVFLVSREEYFDRSGIYGTDGRDYQDNAARFIFFTKCAIELARRMEPPPDVVQFHSWETGLGPVFCRDQRLPFKTVFVPHGLEYQGNFWSFDFGLTNLPGDYFSARGCAARGAVCQRSADARTRLRAGSRPARAPTQAAGHPGVFRPGGVESGGGWRAGGAIPCGQGGRPGGQSCGVFPGVWSVR
jgi:starch synthase